MFINGMPFASMIGAFLLLYEQIRWIHVVAFALTTLGIVIGTFQAKQSSSKHSGKIDALPKSKGVHH